MTNKLKKYEDKTPRMQYLDDLAIKKGYKSNLDMLNHQAIEQGYKSYSDKQIQWLKNKGKTSASYQNELIQKRLAKKECELLKDLSKNHPEILNKSSKKKINQLCKHHLLSDII